MAKSINHVILMGNLTRDPELRQTPNGQNVCSFSLALNRSYRNQSDEWQEATDYVDIVAWAGLGERVAQYLTKGRRCLVQGRLQSRSWEQDGQKRSKLEVVASDVTFLDSRSGSGNEEAPVSSQEQPAKPPKSSKPTDEVVIDNIDDEAINLDDIPF